MSHADRLRGRRDALVEIHDQQKAAVITLGRAIRRKDPPLSRRDLQAFRWAQLHSQQTAAMIQTLIDATDAALKLAQRGQAEGSGATPEALQHGPMSVTHTYEGKRLEKVFRVQSQWEQWARQGVLTEAAAEAAARFEADVHRAGLDSLHACALLDARQSAPHARSPYPAGAGPERARASVTAAVSAVGGHASLPGDLLLSCCGLGKTVASWTMARAGRQAAVLDRSTARGMLAAALESLAVHYRMAAPRHAAP
jgi:hypothetical protein